VQARFLAAEASILDGGPEEGERLLLPGNNVALPRGAAIARLGIFVAWCAPGSVRRCPQRRNRARLLPVFRRRTVRHRVDFIPAFRSRRAARVGRLLNFASVRGHAAFAACGQRATPPLPANVSVEARSVFYRHAVTCLDATESAHRDTIAIRVSTLSFREILRRCVETVHSLMCSAAICLLTRPSATRTTI
jgi:hypothetical protein